MVLALVSGVAHAMLIMTRPVLLQVSGTSNPDEVLTAMRELPESTARDQDHLVPLVAEVVMLSKHGTLSVTTSLYGLVTHSKCDDAACEPSCQCSFMVACLPCLSQAYFVPCWPDPNSASSSPSFAQCPCVCV